MFKITRPVLSPEEMLKEVPLPKELAKIKHERDQIVKNIIDGSDSRKLIIVGPCSADNEDAVCDYVSRLATLCEKVKDKLFVVPRIYTNKPRTRGEGYKGMYHNPDPQKGTDIQAGIISLRHMHIRAIRESGLSAADEMLYPDNYAYVEDLLSYVAVGARSTENQQHRLVASGIDIPVGIKNPMNGSFNVLLNSIYAAQISNEFKYHNNQVKTSGNPYAHAVLRGSNDIFGNNLPNYHYEDILRLEKMYRDENLSNPAVVIDTNHSNSNKDPIEQIRIVKEVISNIRNCNAFAKLVKGFMIESYILDGKQSPDCHEYGKSITDGCLGWEKTERLLFEIAEKL